MGQAQKNRVRVPEGSYVPIPNDQHMLAGPGEIEVTRWPNGQVTGVILSGHPVTPKVALKRRLKRLTWGI